MIIEDSTVDETYQPDAQQPEFILCSASGDECFEVRSESGDIQSSELVLVNRGVRLDILFGALSAGGREAPMYAWTGKALVTEGGELLILDGPKSVQGPHAPSNREIVLYEQNGNAIRFDRVENLKPDQLVSRRSCEGGPTKTS